MHIYTNVANADYSYNPMPTASELLDGMEKEYIVWFAFNWLTMRYFGLMDTLTIAGKEVHTFIDEVVIALAILMAVNVAISVGTDLYSIYQTRKTESLHGRHISHK